MTDIQKTPGEMSIQAAMFAASHLPAEFLSTVATIVKAKEDWTGGPINIWAVVNKLYDGEKFDIFPDPDSTAGNNPCKFVVMRPSGKDGKLKEKTLNWYNVFADNTPPAVALHQRKEWLERLGNDKMKQDGITPEFIAEFGTGKGIARGNELKKVVGQIGSNRTAILDGFKLTFQLLKVNELAGVNAFVVPKADKSGYENIIRVHSSDPARIMDDNEPFTVKSFMKLKPLVAFENGGTFAALMATKKREQDATAPNAGAGKAIIKTVETFFDTAVVVHDFISEAFDGKDKTQYQEILKTIGPKGPAGSDDKALSLYTIYTALHQLYRNDGIRARAERLFEADTTEAKAA